MFKVNNKNTLIFFIVNFKHISHLFLVFLLLTLNEHILTRTFNSDIPVKSYKQKHKVSLLKVLLNLVKLLSQHLLVQSQQRQYHTNVESVQS